MNFLAHLYLSQHNQELMIGNFIADAVKGKNYLHYPIGIQNGIIMHRHIDTYTDTHPITKQSRDKLSSRYHKYAGVLVDVFYDHFLATNWQQYSTIPLPEFADNAYQIMQSNYSILPEKSQFLLPYMIEHNWLLNYAQISGIKRTLTGMSKRTSFVSNMEFATEELQHYYEEFNQEFISFFDEARAHFKAVI